MGFPKCGTTYFADCLGLHPEIGMPTSLATASKEPMHYRKDQVAHARMPVSGFYPMFSSASQHLDASVSYSYDPGAMTWIHRENPDTKVILLVRDQVSVLQSMVNYYDVRLWHKTADELAATNNAKVFRQIPMRKVEQAIELTRRSQQSSSVTRRMPELRGLFEENTETAIRFMHLRFDLWLDMHVEVFGRENLLVLDAAELYGDPDSTMNRAMQFLGLPALDRRIAEQNLRTNASRKVFRLDQDASDALREVFYPCNERLRAIAGVDLNRHK